MKRLILPLIAAMAVSVLQSASSYAAECTDGCIDVYTENGTLVIEGRKGDGPISAKVPAQPKRTVRTPRPRTTQAAKPKVAKRVTVRKPVTKKPVVRKRSTPRPTPTPASFADRLIKLLPTPGLRYQPGYEPLVRMPVYFSSGLPESFNTVVDVVGERVTVKLAPHFHYDFGDGTTLDTADVGGLYPHDGVTHTYKEPGEYNVHVDIVWGGVFITRGVSKAVRGAIELVINAPITVVATTNRFMN